MPEDESKPSEWTPGDSVETRRFRCEVEEDARRWGDQGTPRLQLMANAGGQSRLLMLVPAKQIAAVRKELVNVIIIMRLKAIYFRSIFYVHLQYLLRLRR